jgi:peptidoglycan/xylan/chitin deacetylase (PgdA/CDA1 family)/Flp pilus assembly protein TadD
MNRQVTIPLQLRAVFAVFLFFLTPFSASAFAANGADNYDQSTLQGKILYTIHLIEDARYGEASDATQQIIDSHPDLPFGYELRGLQDLFFDNIKQASADFHVALGVDPENPNCEYGLGLCSLFNKDYPDAIADFKMAGQAMPLSTDQAQGINTALGYVYLLQNDSQTALTFLNSPDKSADPARSEMLAFIKEKQNPGSGHDLLNALVSNPNGLPYVTEPSGVRPDFLSSNVVLEPAIADPATRSMYNARLEQNVRLSQYAVGRLIPVNGVVVLKPPVSQAHHFPNTVYYYVDNHCDLIVNAQPFFYRWDTTNVSNGRHRVRIDLSDGAGQVFSSRQLEFDVHNDRGGLQSSATGDLPDDALEQINLRTWKILSLKPCLKVANYLLWVSEKKAGKLDAANFYRATAAAIDPTYKDGRGFMRELLKSDIGASNPVAVWQGSITGNRVALTFDDGPNAPKSAELLDALDRCHVPATFFVVGSRAALVPDILRRMHDRGDEIENHSYTHPNMAQSAPLDAEEEILRNEVLVRALAGRYPRYFRPPGGNVNATISRLTKSYGLTLAFWTVDALQFEDADSPGAIVAYVMKRLHPGDIILMHDGSDATTKALPALVEALRSRGYKCVTVSQIGYSPVSHKPVSEQSAAIR